MDVDGGRSRRPERSWWRTAWRRPAVAGGALLALVSVGLFAQLVDGVLERGDLSVIDPVVEQRVPALRDSVLNVVADVLALLGSEVCLGIFAAVLVFWVWTQWKDRLLAAVLTASMAVTAGLIVGVKDLVGRVRPASWAVYGPPDPSPAFPSGHTVGTTVFLGLVAGLVVLRWSSWWVRATALGGWVLGSVAVGASRIYLGYHWATDVVAGLVLGMGILALTIVAVDLLRHRRPSWTPAARIVDDLS